MPSKNAYNLFSLLVRKLVIIEALASFSDCLVKVISTFTLVLALGKSLYIYMITKTSKPVRREIEHKQKNFLFFSPQQQSDSVSKSCVSK